VAVASAAPLELPRTTQSREEVTAADENHEASPAAQLLGFEEDRVVVESHETLSWWDVPEQAHERPHWHDDYEEDDDDEDDAD
jgi:hypothetical protein